MAPVFVHLLSPNNNNAQTRPKQDPNTNTEYHDNAIPALLLCEYTPYIPNTTTHSCHCIVTTSVIPTIIPTIVGGIGGFYCQ